MNATPDQVIAQIREALEKAPTREGAPTWIGVDQDGVGIHGGFWTCAAATSDSPRYIRADLVSALLAELDSLRKAKWDVKHVDTMNDMASLAVALEAAEAERDALRKALEPFAALIERSDTMDIEWLEANAPGIELEAYSPSGDKLVSSGEMRDPIFVTRGDFRRARTLSGDKS